MFLITAFVVIGLIAGFAANWLVGRGAATRCGSCSCRHHWLVRGRADLQPAGRQWPRQITGLIARPLVRS